MSAQIGRGAGGAPWGAATDDVTVSERGGTQRNAQGERTPSAISRWFTRAAGATATAMGTPGAFLTALGIIVVWGISGPIFHFSDTWQLVINTGTTIVTFLMVFLIQNTQNRDAKAIHIKLDELIRAVKAARNDIIDIEAATDEDLDQLQRAYKRVSAEAPGEGTPPLPVEPRAASVQEAQKAA